ncbi:MAG: hypothetical protein EHM48_02210 [Planctomycetaceae bacterium]|nr:MAG: hypothetical protein EHM48_02210 [Planctomycetaceae bacterium]
MSSRVGLVFTFAALLTAIMVTPAFGLVMHTADQPVDRPADGVVGLWGASASVVAISPNFAITTVHQSGSNYTDPGHPEVPRAMETITIGATSYYPTFVAWGGSDGGTADIRIVQLWANPAHTTPANLANYVGINTSTNELNKNIVLAGAGATQGTTLNRGVAPNQEAYGYTLGGTKNNANGIHWGTNKISYINTLDTTDVIKGTFDGAGTANATAYEAAAAIGDDGGGMFIKGDDGKWYVAGLLKSWTQHTMPDSAWYRNNLYPGMDAPDQFAGVRISSYDEWIQQYVVEVSTPEPVTMSVLALGGLALLRRRRTA